MSFCPFHVVCFTSKKNNVSLWTCYCIIYKNITVGDAVLEKSVYKPSMNNNNNVKYNAMNTVMF